MRRVSLAVFSLAGAVLVAGCGDPEQRTRPRTSGTLALSSDDSLIYAVDADNEFVAIIDAKSSTRLATVPVGRYPERILLDSNDTAYVANRGDRTVSVFKRDVWDDPVRIPVGVEPVGLALSGDEGTLYVVNAASLTSAEHGSLMAIDTGSRKVKWDLELPAEPRSIALIDDQRAVVSLFKSGDVVEVDLSSQTLVRTGTAVEEKLNQPPRADATMPTDPSFGIRTVKPRGLSQIVLSPDRSKLYVTGSVASDAVLDGNVTPDGTIDSGGSTYGGMSTCSKGGSVASAGLFTFRSDTLGAQVDPVQECFTTDARDYPETLLTSGGGMPIQGPGAMVTDATGTWLYIANFESNNVAIVASSRGTQGVRNEFDMTFIDPGVRALLQVGSAPTGLALSSDGTKLYVHSQFDHQVEVITSTGSGSNTGFNVAQVVRYVDGEVLPPNVVRGRKLFFSALSPQMNSVGISCGSCHLEGREDGHVWNFSMGPRQTPSLAGRTLSATAPFHWGGEHTDFQSFLDHTIIARMGGTGLSATEASDLLAYIDAIPAPDNPHRLAAPTEAQLRGAQVFQKAECSTCHAGASFTNNTNADVGTFVTIGAVVDDLNFFSQHGGLNTPSLLGLARTAPYLHDGSAATLKARLTQNTADRHGVTSTLTGAEVDDLVEYLKAL